MTQDASHAFQDYYPEDVAHCYGCGRLNEHGHRIKSYWDGDETAPRFVTAALHVEYLRPTPLGPELEVRGTIKEASERKVIVEVSLTAAGQVTARGEVAAVRMPERMVADG